MEKPYAQIRHVLTKHKTKILYLFVGTLLFLIDFGFSVLTYYAFNFEAGIASATGFCASFIVGFTLNKKLVFRHNNKSRFKVRTQVSLYLLLASINLIVSAISVDLLVKHGLRIEIVKPILVAGIAYWNYLILGRYIFSYKKVD